MSWYKVDDKLTSHRKFLRLGRIYGVEARCMAMGLWVQAGSWSALNETNGFIPEDITEEFVPVTVVSHVTESDTVDVREALCDVGFWSKTDDGYQFEGWDEYQPTKSGIDEKRAKDAERKRRSRAQRQDVTPMSHVTDSDASAVTTCPPPPSRPDPTRPDPKTNSSAKQTAVAESQREDVEALCAKLRDHIAGNSSKTPEITARWRTEARLLLDRDEIPFDEAVRVLDWCQRDNFWRGNILSLPKFREKFTQLQIKSNQEKFDPRFGVKPSSQRTWLDVAREADARDGIFEGQVIEFKELG